MQVAKRKKNVLLLASRVNVTWEEKLTDGYRIVLPVRGEFEKNAGIVLMLRFELSCDGKREKKIKHIEKLREQKNENEIASACVGK